MGGDLPCGTSFGGDGYCCVLLDGCPPSWMGSLGDSTLPYHGVDDGCLVCLSFYDHKYDRQSLVSPELRRMRACSSFFFHLGRVGCFERLPQNFGISQSEGIEVFSVGF